MKKTSFCLLGVLIICLAAATFVEKFLGTEFVSQQIYGSVWFGVLWGGLALSSFSYILSLKMYRKRISLFILHLSFLVILSGALLTALTAERGYMHLRMNEENRMFMMTDPDQDEVISLLPFGLTLNDFIIEYYPGTSAPADYISHFTVIENEGNTFREKVSMNHIFSYKGARFYQSSYDDDLQGTTFIVNKDKWGTPVTYTGYFLLFFAMLLVLFSPDGKIRKLLRHPSLKKAALFLAGVVLPFISLEANRKTLPATDAAKFAEVQVLYNNRIAPLQTLAFDFTMKITGRAGYQDYTPEQFMAGWIFNPGLWKYEPCIHVKSAAIRKQFNLKEYASLTDFFDKTSTYIFESYWSELHQGKPTALQKAISELDERVQLILMLSKGELLKVFPVTRNGQTTWCNSTAQLPEDITPEHRIFVRKMFALLNEYIVKKDSEKFQEAVSKLLEYQRQNGGESVLPASRLNAERLYNRIPFVPVLFRLNLTAGLIALFFFGAGLIRKRPLRYAKQIDTGFIILLFLAFVFLTFCIGLRTYISGRWPMGNGFETMVFVAWCVMLIALICFRTFRLVVPFGYLLSGFFLLVASFSLMNPQITTLMPVLSSPLLSLHVSTIMISYALLAFTFLAGVISIILCIWKKNDARAKEQVEALQVMSGLFLIPGVCFLGVGIFVGAIWANVSWGRYWAWDPKEVWALITFLFYSVAIHSDSLKIFRRPLYFHLYMCVAFLTILMTYFGVNYVLGGLHSYA